MVSGRGLIGTQTHSITLKTLTTLLPSSSPSLFHNLNTGQILIIIQQSTKFFAQGMVATCCIPGKSLNYPGVAESREILWKIAECCVPLFPTVVGLSSSRHSDILFDSLSAEVPLLKNH